MKLKRIVSNLLLLCLISLVGCSTESFQDEDISLQNLRVSPKTQLQVYPLKHIIS